MGRLLPMQNKDMDKFVRKVNADIQGGGQAWVFYDPQTLKLFSYRQGSTALKKLKKKMQAQIDGNSHYKDVSVHSVEFFIGVYRNGQTITVAKGKDKGETRHIPKASADRIRADCNATIFAYQQGGED